MIAIFIIMMLAFLLMVLFFLVVMLAFLLMVLFFLVVVMFAFFLVLLLFLVVILVFSLMLLLFLVVILVFSLMVFVFLIMAMTFVFIMEIHVIKAVSMLIVMLMMSRYAILILITAYGKSGIPARADPGQAARYILRISAAVGQGAPPGLARFDLGKPRDIVIIGIARHAIEMKGKITCSEIQPAATGHAVRNGFILQGNLAFYVVRHIIKYPAVYEIDDAPACATAEQQRCGAAKYLNLLSKHRFRWHRVVGAQTSDIHSAEPIFQYLYPTTGQSADNGTA